MQITEAQYQRIAHYLPGQRGNARLPNRQVLYAIPYVTEHGCQWRAILTFPPFDDILTSAQVGEAQAEPRRREAEEEVLRQQVALEARQSALNVRQAEEQLLVGEKTVKEAQENMEPHP